MKKWLVLLWIATVAAAYAETPPPVKHASAFIQFKGTPKKVRSLLDQLAGDDAYKAAECKPMKTGKTGAVLGLSCDKPGSALMDMLDQHAPSGVTWTLSARGCAAGCGMMHCPMPSGPILCCKFNKPCGLAP
jgi:hypothetical protein